MGQFMGELRTTAVEDGYKLDFPLSYRTDAGRIITVPMGFVTDLASIPRIFRTFFTGHGKSRKPAVIHDYLYSLYHPRKRADKIFLEALKASGMNWIGRRTMYLAVRAGGWIAYRGKNADSKRSS